MELLASSRLHAFPSKEEAFFGPLKCCITSRGSGCGMWKEGELTTQNELGTTGVWRVRADLRYFVGRPDRVGEGAVQANVGPQRLRSEGDVLAARFLYGGHRREEHVRKRRCKIKPTTHGLDQR